MSDETAPAYKHRTGLEALEQLERDLAMVQAAAEKMALDLTERAQRQDVIAEDLGKVSKAIAELQADAGLVRQQLEDEGIGPDDEDEDEGADEDEDPADELPPARPRRSSSSSRRRR